MSRKAECPHKDEKMCVCEALQSGDPITQIAHLFGSIQEPKAELSYTTLENPHPYRLCVFGTCKTCGKRLCICLEKSGDLAGDDFLKAVCRQMDRVFGTHFGVDPDVLHRMFAELFHEEDRLAVRRWLEGTGTSNDKEADMVPVPEGGTRNA